MLMLLFSLGNDRYAIESKRVVEIVPLVALQKLQQAPDYIAGLFNYRGLIVPVIDLCHLIQGHPCRPYLSTRIVLVNYLGANNTSHLLGLIAERVTEILNRPETEFIEPEIPFITTPYLGKIIRDEQGMIQCVRVDSLLPESQSSYLLPRSEE